MISGSLASFNIKRCASTPYDTIDSCQLILRCSADTPAWCCLCVGNHMDYKVAGNILGKKKAQF